MKKRATIAGYYGFGNVGDEAVLTAMLLDIGRLRPDTEFTILSENPEQTSSTHRVKSVFWRDLEAVIAAIEESDLLIVGGGGLYNSYLEYASEQLLTQNNSMFSVFIFGLPFLARLLGKPCMIYGVGASRVNAETARRHVRLSLEAATVATVRDPGSKAILESFGVQSERIRVTADPAFRLANANSGRIKEILTNEGIFPTRPVVGVVIRNWTFSASSKQWEPKIAAALSRFVREHNGSILFIPFQRSRDTPDDLSNDMSIIDRVTSSMSQVADILVLRGAYSPQEVSGILASCDLVLGMRLHSVVLAIKNHVPFVALSYEPKVANILAAAGLEEHGMELSLLTNEKLFDALRTVYGGREKIRARLSKVADEMQGRAFENARLAAQLLDSCRPLEHPSSDRYGPIRPSPPSGSEVETFLLELGLKQTKLLVLEEKRANLLRRQLLAFQSALRHLVDTMQFHAALSMIQSLLREQPNHPEWNYLAGFILQMKGKDPQASLHHYDAALEHGFDEFWIRYNRGALYAQLGDADAALLDLQRAIQLRPDHSGPLEILEQLGRNESLGTTVNT